MNSLTLDPAKTCHRLPASVRMRRSTARAALVLCTCLAGTDSVAREICWIDHVAPTEGGVAIYFSPPSALSLTVGPTGSPIAGAYRVSNGAVTRNGSESDRLNLPGGATVYVSQTAEDGCTLQVIVGTDQRGVLAKASNHTPGIAAATASRFIRAK